MTWTTDFCQAAAAPWAPSHWKMWMVSQPLQVAGSGHLAAMGYGPCVDDGFKHGYFPWLCSTDILVASHCSYCTGLIWVWNGWLTPFPINRHLRPLPCSEACYTLSTGFCYIYIYTRVYIYTYIYTRIYIYTYVYIYIWYSNCSIDPIIIPQF